MKPRGKGTKICTVCGERPPRQANGNTCSNDCEVIRQRHPGNIVAAQEEYRRTKQHSKYMDWFIYGRA